jgi:hypothetical protein
MPATLAPIPECFLPRARQIDGYARARLAAATSYNAQPIEVVPA